MVAVLTSSFTLDATNPAARREMNQLADLVGAVRLPTGSHRKAAGTDAMTDLLIFRRREPGQEPASTLWETVTARQIDGTITRLNSYFDEYPERLLGELQVSAADNGFTIVENGSHIDLAVPKTQAIELGALLGLRDAARKLLSAEAENRDHSDRPQEPAVC